MIFSECKFNEEIKLTLWLLELFEKNRLIF